MKTLLISLLLISAPALAVDRQSTFAAGTAAFSPPATPTDLCYIVGSSTKQVKLRKVEFTSTQTTAGINSFFLVKRSTADSAGTCTQTSPVSYSNASAVGTANVWTCTANPTLGTLQGNVRSGQFLSPAPASLADGLYGWEFPLSDDDAPIILNNQNDMVAINFAGAALPTGLSVECTFIWTEQ